MQLTALSLALTRVGLGGFAPSSLFLYGEQGVWYEPSLTNGTLYQNSAGTTPVTAVEQPVGLMLDKSKGLVLGPELVADGSFDAGVTALPYVVRGTVTHAAGSAILTTTTVTGGVGVTVALVDPIAISAGLYEVEISVSSRSVASSITSLLVVASTAPNSGLSATSRFSAPGVGVYRGLLRMSAGDTITIATFDATINDSFTIDNISVRELPGNHAFQTTTTSRPVLSARYNLLTKTEQFDDVAWVKDLATATANTITDNSTLGFHAAYIQRAFTAGEYTLSVEAKLGTNYGIFLRVREGSIQSGSTTHLVAAINLTTGAQVSAPIGALTVNALSDGYYRITITGQIPAVTANVIVGTLGPNGETVYAGTGTFSYIRKIDLRPANQASLPYQRVNTSTDYDADPAKFPVYLRFDGVDDWLQTNSIDFTATDKMTVFAGVRKLSDAAAGVVAELSALYTVNAGSFGLFAPGTASNNYSFVSRGVGGTNDGALGSGFTAPITNVVTGIADISGDARILRVNGTQAAINTDDQGTGNYGNYPLYIGRRGGATLPFNGQIYSLIVRGAQTSTTQIAQTETWVNGKTKAY